MNGVFRTIEATVRSAGRHRRALGQAAGWVAVGVLVGWLASTPARLNAAQTPAPANGQATSMTSSPVVGPSWLALQGLELKDTAMCWTGALGPGIADDQPPTEMPPLTIHLDAPPPGHSFTMTGKDLYRLNCQSCHGSKGEGSPPEINSLLGPVQGASLEMTLQRLKASGAPVSADFVKSLVQTGKQALHDRLVNGGKKMPPFRRLTTTEVQALEAYLDLLAGIPGAEARQVTVTEPYDRVGELMVKGTCHICHDATGPGKEPELLMEGVRPSLVTLPHEDSLALFVQKTVQGAPILMGTPPILHRGRMPVFYYFTQDEVAAAYDYLNHYPAQPRPAMEADVAAYAH